ncbi:MAG: SpoIID/LytB domain-containing protein [Ignavibacteriaceae bacterium]|nr:SpoIID/LytB domain-containing protein [Ignavibacteriaceae bacterium]
MLLSPQLLKIIKLSRNLPASKLITFSFFMLILFIISGCGASKKFEKEESNAIENYNDNSSLIRVLLDERMNLFSYTVEDPVVIKNELKTISHSDKGDILKFYPDGNNVKLEMDGKTYLSKFYQILPETKRSIKVSDKSYKGAFRIASQNNKIQVINTITLEEYIKGVVPMEMPIGKGTENYEVLKAFSICVRTYAIKKLNSKNNFDIYNDVRDQVYGGESSERILSNKAVRETRGLVLTYNNSPAATFYHSTCGGYTEDGTNVFQTKNAPYLQSIKDGDEPYCSISPKYQWKEIYSESDFIHRLKAAELISGPEWKLDKINVNSRFQSGRVNELQITLQNDNGKDKIIKIYGNNIRKIIRSSDNLSILNSTLFDISIDEKNNVVITGKGNGHGVGLCQWGAINLSRMGKDFVYILSHYYPGTKILRYYD